MEIFPELEYCKTGSRKIYHTEAGSRKFQRSGDEAAAGSGKLQDPYFKQTPKWKYILQRSIIFEVQIGEMKRWSWHFEMQTWKTCWRISHTMEFALRKEDGSFVKASELTADGKHILAFLEEEKEPTEHIF